MTKQLIPLSLKWTARFVALAEQWASYSTCVRRKVGAVVLDLNTKAVLSIGYNDTPSGRKNCGDGGCTACQRGTEARYMLDCNCVHAEMNATLLAARRGVKLEGTYMITTMEPCASCQKHMAQAGIGWIATQQEED